MSWASRRRTLYIAGTVLFFVVGIGGPLAHWYLTRPGSCFDGVQNLGETTVDKGGPCRLLDERLLTPEAIAWTRAFSVRGGEYNAVAYIENANPNGGVQSAPYRFRLYDDNNVLVAEQLGSTYVMPGSVTPIFAGPIDTGNRKVARAYFEFTAPLVWERLTDAAKPVVVQSKQVTDTTAPRLVAIVENTSVVDLRDVQFVAAIFDTAGNAFAASSTVVPLLAKGVKQEIVFTWPDPFLYLPGRIDILPLVKPGVAK